MRSTTIDISLAIQLHQQGRLEEAAALYTAAIAAQPRHADALQLLGVIRAQQERTSEAYDLFRSALRQKPSDVFALSNFGKLLVQMKRHEEAVKYLDKAIALDPRHAENHKNRGNALAMLARFRDALASYDRALVLQPDDAEAHSDRGAALADLSRPAEALASYDTAIRCNPSYFMAHSNRGNALVRLDRHGEAVASYDTAIALEPGYSDAHYNRAEALRELGRPEDALAGYRRAVELDPDDGNALGMYVHYQNVFCCWADSGRARQTLLEKCRQPTFDGPPLVVLSVTDDPQIQRDAAQSYIASSTTPAPPVRFDRKRRSAGQKIRLGYLSADFREHPVAILVAELIEIHDRSRFEVFGFSAGPNDDSPMRQRLERAFDTFIDVERLSDDALRQAIRSAGIDILIDLGGHTQKSRMLALAERAAPIQATYLGYAATTGAPFIDYAIVDRHVVPPGDERYFTEHLVYLPDCFQCNDRKRVVDARAQKRSDHGLPDDGFVFCCFNGTFKLNPQVFDVWMRILSSTPGSVLWLGAASELAMSNLRRAATERGVDHERLVFAPRMSYPEHLNRQRLANLFLDTWPYNAHTTASDALWVGLPVLTCAGHSYAARVAASLLQAAGAPELITHSWADYEALALRLATRPDDLRALRQRLESTIARSVLFDTDRFCRHMEDGCVQMMDLYRRGSPPKSIDVAARLPASP